jgi:RNA polymerase sigma factor (sigma-70 family)
MPPILAVTAPEEASPFAAALEAERKAVIMACLLSLSPRHARLIILRFWRNRTLREIADGWGVSEPAVHAMQRRALAGLREALARFGVEARSDLL